MVGAVAVEAGDFQEEGDVLEGRVAHYGGKTRLADVALADVVVAVNAGAAKLFGVVGVHRCQVFRADGLVKLGNHRLHPVRRGQVITGGETVLGVQADAEAGVIHSLENAAQFLELGSQVLAHSGHVLQAQVGAFGRVVQHSLDGVHRLVEHLLVALPLVAAGVEDNAVSPDVGGQGHIVDERLDALFHQLRVGAAQVDEVDGVEEDGAHAPLFPALLEGGHFLLRRMLEGPTAGGGTENLDGLAADVGAPVNGLADAAGR